MIAVVRFPGSNCDEDVRWALGALGADARLVWHRETDLAGAEAVVLPGGFSYGDYLRGGAIAAKSPLTASIVDFARRGGPVLGICNGFQVLTESGLLPGALALNDPPHFICRDAVVTVERTDLPWTSRYGLGQELRLPVAHTEGRYYLGEAERRDLQARGGVLFRYRSNINGSVGAIAGVVNERGNVLGMMPHPERAVEELLGGSDGRPLLQGLLDSLSSRPTDPRRAVDAAAR